MANMVINPIFWKGRKVLMTGHTGFKGGWLSLWLNRLGAKITGYALEPPTSPALFEDAQINTVLQDSHIGDICDLEKLTKVMQSVDPEIVIHLAAQPLVRHSYTDPLGTYSTNVMGAVNLFEAVRNTSSVKAVLNITTDKCYKNREWVWGYREDEPMGGHDPYSSSKGCVELISDSYRNSFLQKIGIGLGTARAGNVIGGGDWAKDRIVPDAIRAFIKKEPLLVRNPLSTRPWQHVLEPLSGYIILAQQLFENPEAFSEGWNFGPNDDDAQPVSVLADIMVKNWSDQSEWRLDEGGQPHEANYLKLDCSKAKAKLKWYPIWNIDRALEETVRWYRAWHDRSNMHKFTMKQIEIYQHEFEI